MSLARAYQRVECRLCGSRDLPVVLRLPATPPANEFVPASMVGKPQEAYPLDLHQCGDCGHVQLLTILDPLSMFKHYVYVSGTNKSFVAHFDAMAQHLHKLLNLQAGEKAVDIGSNDGVLLRALQGLGLDVLGVDPAEGIARRATEAGIPTVPEFFTHSLGQRLAKFGLGVQARLVTANNVFAHVDDLADFTEGVKAILAPNGVFVFEVAYLPRMLLDGTIDLVYHEHVSFHHVRPLVRFFRQHGLELVRVEDVPTHGGSIRCFVQGPYGPLQEDGSVGAHTRASVEGVVEDRSAWSRLEGTIAATGLDLRRRVCAHKDAGATVIGIGAPAKATTLLHAFDLGGDLSWIVDASPLKVGLHTPGHHIPVRGEDSLHEPWDAAVLLAWNLADSIVEKYRADPALKGRRVIIPFPAPPREVTL